MKQLETLLGMDLPEEAKELLKAVNDGYKSVTDANATMVETIASKENANAELIQARKTLKEELQEVKDSKSKTDDKTVQEKLDALNAEWNDKHQAVVNERDTIKTDMLNKTKFDSFNALNVASLLPSEWDKSQVAIAMSAIENQVLSGATHDEVNGWVYKDNEVTTLNPTTGKPLTIAEKFESVKSSGAINMFLADKASSGSGEVPNVNGAKNTTTANKDMTPSEKAKRIQEIGSDAYLAEVQNR